MQEKDLNTELPVPKDSNYYKIHGKKPPKQKHHNRPRRFRLIDYLLKNVVPIIGCILILIGLILIVKDKLSDILAFLFAGQKIKPVVTELPPLHSFFHFQSIRYYFLFLPGILLVITSFLFKRKNIINQIISLVGYSLIYYKLFDMLANSTINIYQAIFIIVILTVVGIYTVFDLASVFIFLFIIVMNIFSLFLLYFDAYLIVLLPFLAILNLFYGYISLKKNWQLGIALFNVLSMIFFGVWVVRKIIIPDSTIFYSQAFMYNTILYLSIFIPVCLYIYRNKGKYPFIDLFNILSLSFFYFIFCILILIKTDYSEYLGLYGLLAGIFYFIFYYLFKRFSSSGHYYIFSLIAAIFLSAALPLEVKYFYVLFFLSVMFSFLIWFSKSVNNKIYIWIPVIFSVAIIVYYSIIWVESYITAFDTFERNILTVDIGKSSFAGLVIIVSYLSGNYLLEYYRSFYSDKKGFLIYGVKYRNYNIALKYISFMILYPTSYYYFNYILSDIANLHMLNVQLWYSFTLIYILSLIVYTNRNKDKTIRPVLGVLSLGVALLYPLLIHRDSVRIRNVILLSDNLSYSYFIYHYINIALACITFYLAFAYYRKKYGKESFFVEILYFISAIYVLFFISTEYNNYYLFYFYSTFKDIDLIIVYSNAIFFSIIWTLYAFVLIYIAIKRRIKVFRTTALFLVFFTVLKIFIYDFDRSTETTRIITLIVIGILLIVLSITYRRLRRILFSKEYYQKHRRKY